MGILVEGGVTREEAACCSLLAASSPGGLRRSPLTAPLMVSLPGRWGTCWAFPPLSVSNFCSLYNSIHQWTDNSWVSGMQMRGHSLSYKHSDSSSPFPPLQSVNKPHSWIARLKEKQRLSNSVVARRLVRNFHQWQRRKVLLNSARQPHHKALLG